jgi:hypothetical protein
MGVLVAATLLPQQALAAPHTKKTFTAIVVLPYQKDHIPTLEDFTKVAPTVSPDGRVGPPRSAPRTNVSAPNPGPTYDAYLGPDKKSLNVAAAYDYLTKEECREQDLPEPADDWAFKNHFAACQRFRYGVLRYDCKDNKCQQTGVRHARATILGFGTQDGRNIQFELFLDDWNSDGSTVDPKTVVSFNFICTTPSLELPCTSQSNPIPDMSVTKTLEGWEQDGFYRYAVNPTGGESDSNTHPLDNVHKYVFALQSTQTYLDGVAPSQTVNFESVLVRCDNASYITGRQCLFPEVTAVLHMDYDQDICKVNVDSTDCYKQSVEFIYTAMHHLDQVKANSEGLYVPGGFYEQPLTGRFEPLTRNYYGTQSRTIVRAECARLFGADYATNAPDGKPRDCDEYPFASTYQSANYDTTGTASTWAVKALYAVHNQSAGRLYAAWYRADGIIDGDPFYIQIDNAPEFVG